LFHSLFLVQGFDSHVKYSLHQLFIGGRWVLKIFLPDASGFIFQIRLSPTRTDAAAISPFLFAQLPPAASILNSLIRWALALIKTNL
jgi:hypothetical protein